MYRLINWHFSYIVKKKITSCINVHLVVWNPYLSTKQLYWLINHDASNKKWTSPFYASNFCDYHREHKCCSHPNDDCCSCFLIICWATFLTWRNNGATICSFWHSCWCHLPVNDVSLSYLASRRSSAHLNSCKTAVSNTPVNTNHKTSYCGFFIIRTTINTEWK